MLLSFITRSVTFYGFLACLLIFPSCSQDDGREPTSAPRVAGEGDTLDTAVRPTDGLPPDDRIVLLECCSGDSVATPDTVVISRGSMIWFSLVHGDSAAVDMLPADSDYDDVVDDSTKRKILHANDGRLIVGFTVRREASIGLRPYEVTIYGCEDGPQTLMMRRGVPVMDIRE